MAENETQTNKNVSSGLVPIPSGTFEHDVAVGGKYQNFSTEILRLSLAAIGAIGFLVVNNSFSKDQSGKIEWLIKHSSFGFWLFTSLFCFGFAAAFALLHLYFSADSKAYHLKYLRLENKLGGNSGIKKENRRKDFSTCWNLYWNVKEHEGDDKLIKQAADERDVRDFLLKMCGKLLLISAIFLWVGAITLVFSFIPVLF